MNLGNKLYAERVSDLERNRKFNAELREARQIENDKLRERLSPWDFALRRGR